MKTKRIYFGLALLSFIAWSCTTQNELSNSSLKSSINTSAQSLTTAINTISASEGYQLLTSQSSTANPSMVRQSVAAFDSTYNQILLADINGIWDYKAALYKRWNPSLLHFFQNTGTSNDMVVRLPESKVKNPRALFHFSPADTTLVNNYVIDVSKYAYHFNRYLGWDYNMASNIAISGVSVGDLAIQSSRNKTNGYLFNSSFAFANGYTANTSYTSGDTIISVNNISKNNQTLYEEKFTSIKTSGTNRHREKQYSLTIGNVQIVREAGKNSMDSAKVYVGGVLQLHSKIQFVDASANSTESNDSTEETTITNHKREIQITFDDGTSTTIKALLGNTIDNISNLFASLRQTEFATDLVDQIAWNIYTNKNKTGEHN